MTRFLPITICFFITSLKVKADCNPAFTATAQGATVQVQAFDTTPGLVHFWRFADYAWGNTWYAATSSYTYLIPGTYTIMHRLIDSLHNCEDSAYQTVTINFAVSCTAYFTYVVNPSLPNQINFTAVSNETITSQAWLIWRSNNSYDTAYLTLNNPTYTFNDTGYYWVCLYIATSTGCGKWFCGGININSVGIRLPAYPNPAYNIVSFRLLLPADRKVSITVYNLTGNAVSKTEKQGYRGNNWITIPVQQLKAGQYYIDINDGHQRKRSIFQKM